ncbi:MAG: hypothetical protein EOM05_11605 [Clostridia bacterium]|nr:hypothetical protein [Clostridia bacterium]
MSFGSKIFMQEKKENNLINFKTVKINVNKTLYQGQYLFLFTANVFFKEIIHEFEELSQNVVFVDNENTEKGEKITLSTFA